MSSDINAIEIDRPVRRYDRTDAVDGLSLRVQPGRCYGFFGRNGAGKTTTIKCLLNLLRPTSGATRVFGLDPARHEVAASSRVRAGLRRLLSLDDDSADARLLCVVPQPME